MAMPLTERELDVMSVLWEYGPARVAEVQEQIRDVLAYTTVLTILRTLEEKGHVRHEAEGRAYRYYPLIDRNAAAASALRRLVRKKFSGSPELLLTQLASEGGTTTKQLEGMRNLLNERLDAKERG